MSLVDALAGDGRRWVRLGDCYEVTRKPRGMDLGSVDSIPFIPMDGISQGGAYEARFDMRPLGSLTSGTYFERGDILLAKITPSFENGKQALVADLPEPFGYATTEVIPLRPRDDRHDRRFLFFYLLHPAVREQLKTQMEGSTGRQRVPERALLDLPVPDFDYDEQVAIADALEGIHKARDAESRCETAAQNMKRAAMRALFSRGLKGEPQKETELGPVPKSWEFRAVGELATRMQYGLSLRGQPSGKYPILRMNCQQDGRVVLRDLQYVDVDEETAAAYWVNRGDILFNRTNSYELVGRTAIVDIDTDAVFASYLIRVTVDGERIDPRFLNHYLNWDVAQGELKKLASRGVSQANISAGKLREFVVPVPSLDEQREIVSILDTLDRKIEVHRRKREVLDELFKTLLHKLMTGEVRVTDLDLSVLEPEPVAAEVG